jgi:hypothetical protein
MIYELRTYTVISGQLGTVVKEAGEVGRPIRGDDYGKLEGYWQTEIGPLGQVMHLWSYASFDERQRLRLELAKNPRWVNEYLPLIQPRLVRQDIRLMQSFLPFKPPRRTGNVYEYRNYRAKPGKAREWAGFFTEVMPVREKYSENVCAWITEAGQPNEVSHLWAYPDLNARAEVRGKAMKDPAWMAFLAKSAPLLDEMRSTILLPAPHSPMR